MGRRRAFGAADRAHLDLLAPPAQDGDEEQRELVIAPQALPDARVVAPRALVSQAVTESLEAGAETEHKKEQGGISRVNG